MIQPYLRLLGGLAFAIFASTGYAQLGGGFGGGGAVGGVVVDPSGMIRSARADERADTLAMMRQSIRAAQGDVADKAELRMISLGKLQAAIVDNEKNGTPISDEMRCLAGLQRVEYVFVYPESNDIVIAGPAEPWKVREDASVVGVESGMPVVTLDNLIVAFRTVETARQEGLTCSIEPTADGRQNLQNLLKSVKLAPGQNPRGLEPAMREAFGPQMILLTGIDKETHYARTLVAADYQMKRIAMELEPSPVTGLPSYLSLAKNGRHAASSNPRWWMACDYDALTHAEDKLAWRIAGQGVKTLTDNDVIQKNGEAVAANKADVLAQKWADMMTNRFDALAQAQPVFGELRNCMDLSVVATLIVQERLAERAGLDLAFLTGSVGVDRYVAPKAVEPECSFVRGRAGWVVTASGGVDINAFEVVANQQPDESLDTIRTRSTGDSSPTGRWWWNG